MTRGSKKRSRINWGFVVVVSVLAAAAALITLAKPLGVAGVPTWEELLEAPVAANAPANRDDGSGAGGAPTEDPGEAVPPSGVTVHIIDVGQGDSILIQTEDSNVLIDAGPVSAAQTVTGYLREQGVERLDIIIATHPHADHIGGMAEVVKRFAVERIIAPQVEAAGGYSYEKLLEAVAAKGLRLTRPHPGDAYELGGASLTVLGPVEYDAENMNNNSIATRLVCGDTSFLFMGDAEAGEEKSILASGGEISADVLKLGHHGSSTSTTERFAQAVNPRWAVASCAWDNSYGHPHREVLGLMEQLGVQLWRTDTDGTVVFTSNGADITVASEKAGEKAA